MWKSSSSAVAASLRTFLFARVEPGEDTQSFVERRGTPTHGAIQVSAAGRTKAGALGPAKRFLRL